MAELEGLLPESEEAIFVFLRWPEPGRTKSRLIPRLGPVGAAEFYRRTAERVFEVVSSWERPGLLRVAYIDPPERVAEFEGWMGDGFHVLAQPDGDVGRKMEDAFVGMFRNRARRVVAIGTDCVEITHEILDEAFEALQRCDAAIGPCLDGGYYLIGLNRPCHHVFRGIPWSTDRVLRETLGRLRSCGLVVRLLPPLLDIDDPEQLDADATGLAAS